MNHNLPRIAYTGYIAVQFFSLSSVQNMPGDIANVSLFDLRIFFDTQIQSIDIFRRAYVSNIAFQKRSFYHC